MSSYYVSRTDNHIYGPGGQTEFYVEDGAICNIHEGGRTGYYISDEKVYSPYGYTGCYVGSDGSLQGQTGGLPWSR